MAKERLRYRVQQRLTVAGDWITVARFMLESDAMRWMKAEGKPNRHCPFRILKGRCVVAEHFALDEAPSSAAAGDRAAGEGTGAPEH